MTHSTEPRENEIWHDAFRKSTSVATREIAGETLLVPISGEIAQLHKLFTLNPVGAIIWDQLDGRVDLAAIRHRLVDRFEVSEESAGQDLLEYVEHLLEAQLIEKLDER